ncbi:MAG TPA: sigma-54 dependent transcriptional regulator [Planctomycetota bacterium]|nr:sigma-54 dependent transcriptional regulator [Planctomycetota bacterium]
MQRAPTPSLLLEVWREVCRHIDIDESLARIAPILAQTLPVTRVLVRRVDREARRLVTIAEGSVAKEPAAPAAARSDLDGAALALVAGWLKQGQVQSWRAGESSELRRALASEAAGAPPRALVAGPLRDAGDGVPDGAANGLLLVEGSDELVERANVVALLLEPVAVALANDRRLHEMARLREAAEAENRALLSRLQRNDITESVVGADSGLKDVMTRVDQVSRTDAPVLILGETGSGKEVVARSIHVKSRRSGGPFLRVNCGAIPSELVDSELFGHERGSFTGALAQRKGWFERADGGTLFLDEIAELPAAAQVRLLRVLQDGSFERVGGQHALNVDVRIVAATHRDMQQLIADGRFRQDLWFRISVFPIRLPSLRERREDVGPLARHFAERAGLRLHGVPLVPSDADVTRLESYPWPGNVRELAAVIERAAILGDGRHLEIAAALGGAAVAVAVAATAPPAAAPSEPSTNADPASLDGAHASLDAAMIRHIEDALAATGGRIEGPAGAAARLDVNPHTLRSRMRKLGIDWRRFRPGSSATPVPR